jgi:NhaA family Na+:H+ antiporter
MATDIAFALGVISLLGKRVPLSLKVFLTAIAIADDVGAILVIAIAYTEHVSMPMLQLAAVAIACLAVMNLRGVTALSAYIVVGAVLWYLVLKSGVHATLAGVVTAFAIPLAGGPPGDESPLARLEHGLYPWVAFGIMPIFALANAGVAFAGAGLAALTAPVTLGIVAGLVVGKVIGVFGAAALLIALRLATLPEGASWLSLLGIAAVCGVGFTMSLFIGTLAFDSLGDPYVRQVRIGVIAGSVISGCIGAALLALGTRRASG